MVLTAVLPACSGGETASVDTTTSVSETVPTGSDTPWAAPERGRRRLVGFDAVMGTVTAADGAICEVCLLVAERPDRRTRGLMHVTDPELGGHDGIVFVNDPPQTGQFWMRSTRLPLTAVFFDEAGGYLESTAMEPCPDDVADAFCPRYGPDEPFRYGVELAARTPAELLMEGGSVLTLTDEPCPEVLDGRTVDSAVFGDHGY